ncbi:D-erythronate dehydrogenase-like [Anticarsia gemmatalis]|uniref:D-erythronate dehydrogenase-like n=1 Tax=Anticarsia gemmatalis TaxID=129554 RepID=UPI003F75AEFE
MKVIVTGAAGFLGSRVADALLNKDSPIKVTKLVLTDVFPIKEREDPRVVNVEMDLGEQSNANKLVDYGCDVFLHLAAVVSGKSEAEYDFGMRGNLDATRYLLEALRKKSPATRFVFASSVGVFGGDVPPVLDDLTAVMPPTSYGTAKAMCELLVNDFGRRGFVDACSVRLPTVSVRAGAPNTAVTSFASGIIREPLNGIPSVCPVPPEQEMWLTSPATVVKNIIYAATLPKEVFGSWRTVNLPGFTVSVGNMVKALKTVAGEKVASLVSFKRDETLARINAIVPSKFDNTKALKLGFYVDTNFEDVIRMYIRDDLKKSL